MPDKSSENPMPIVDEVQRYLTLTAKANKLLRKMQQIEGYSETPEGQKRNYWRVFVVGKVEDAEDREGNKYFAVSPIDPEFSRRIPGLVNISGFRTEIVYDNREPGQLQEQHKPGRWDIILTKRVGGDMGVPRSSLQVIKP